MKKLSEMQKKLLYFYSKKSWVDIKEIIDWIENWKTTIQEIKDGILGVPAK